MSAPSPVTASGRTTRPGHGGRLRRDIQGLRAVAVVAVIADHLLGAPAGGFVGVDVFFVVSGFLITGHLLRSVERTGRVGFADFYRRRVKRILPAAVLVLVVGTAASWLLLTPARFATVLTDALWALCFGANWRFIAVGTDYFQATGPVSPFQHYWSLAVEEQFYLLWPWLLLLLVLIARRGRRPRTVVGAGALVLTLASFVWAVRETATEPTWAYFSTASRAWELGVGAVLAVAAPSLERVPVAVRPVLAWGGLAGIVLALAVVRSTGGFPAPEAALPVLGTALVVPAGTSPEPQRLRVLTSPVMVRIGDLSYSLYLWHFPVIVLLPLLLPGGTPAEIVLAAALILVLSIASYRLVEQPVRRSHLLERRPGPPARGWRTRPLAIAGVAALAVAGIAATGLAVAGQVGAPAPRSRPVAASTPRTASSAPRPTAASSPVPSLPSAAALPALQAEIRSALAARAWPALHPDVAAVGGAARVTEWTKDGCLIVSNADLPHCEWGSATAPRTVAVVGDSIALSWLPAIRGALEPAGYRVVALDMAGCPAAELRMWDWGSSSTFAARCLAHLDWAVGRIRSLRPALVLASSAPSTEWRLADGAQGDRALAEWQQGQERLFERITPYAGTVVVLDPPPPGKALTDCQTRFSSPADCAGPLPAYLAPFVAASARAASATRVTRIATAGWFCVDGRCPAFVGRTPVFADEQHLTEAYARRLTPVLAAALAAAKLAFVPGAPAVG